MDQKLSTASQTNGEAGPVHIEKAISRFLESQRARGSRPATIAYYCQHLSTFQTFMESVGVDDLKQVNKEHVDSYLTWMQAKGNKPRTVNAHLRALRALINYNVEYEWLDRPIKIRLVKEQKELIKTFDDEEIGRLLEPPKADADSIELRDWAMVYMMLQTGMRRNTLLHMTVGDVDFDNDVILLRTTKNRIPQMIPLLPNLSRALRRYLRSRPELVKTDYLFCTRSLAQLQPRSIEDRIRKYCTDRGVSSNGSSGGCHIFRHSYARWVLRQGMDILTLQKTLGHQSLDMTQKYANLLVSDIREKFGYQFDIFANTKSHERTSRPAAD